MTARLLLHQQLLGPRHSRPDHHLEADRARYGRHLLLLSTPPCVTLLPMQNLPSAPSSMASQPAPSSLLPPPLPFRRAHHGQPWSQIKTPWTPSHTVWSPNSSFCFLPSFCIKNSDAGSHIIYNTIFSYCFFTKRCVLCDCVDGCLLWPLVLLLSMRVFILGDIVQLI
jgi:hypothetical protein